MSWQNLFPVVTVCLRYKRIHLCFRHFSRQQFNEVLIVCCRQYLKEPCCQSMASFYPSEGDMLPTAYLLNPKLVSYSSPQHDESNNKLRSDLNPYPYTNSTLCSLLSSDVQSDLQLCENNGLKNVQYLSFDLAGRSSNTVNYCTNFVPYLQQHQPPATLTICNSKYLKAAQDLLNELASVHRAPKPTEKFKNIGQDGSAASEQKDLISTDMPDSTNKTLSPSERHDLQNKVAKLSDMLDEVNRRYRQYCHQIQAVVSSFDGVVGHGAARPYTSLALRTISCQFGSLRNAIKKQIQEAQKSLGEHDGNPHSVLTRLRNMDQQLRQQRAAQQFGVMRQPWRPQRGLPETAVTVLRSWLFEHFLHPYPKDSEKIVLARQTGLTRSQVANWFINARVRLWKPMIEEMYKGEFGDPETESKSSPELVAAGAQETSTLDGNEEDSNELRPDHVIPYDVDRTRLSYDNLSFQGW
ncbi:BEL1-like homeodomain protein 7 isoform X2 [Andrographis paniculata]|uniref:BEL1-like homeodomain protein 7 isoform X2 n=1 Tax=Andrographis paniculata TaxID=175694 RepID=UPI0021E94589|nr:BEL1-like homeodomain protein 7 isoform X2 [Andrographis paniculata]